MTTTRHPEPSSCRKEHTLLPLKNETKEPENSMPAGTKATSALNNVAFIVWVLGGPDFDFGPSPHATHECACSHRIRSRLQPCLQLRNSQCSAKNNEMEIA